MGVEELLYQQRMERENRRINDARTILAEELAALHGHYVLINLDEKTILGSTPDRHTAMTLLNQYRNPYYSVYLHDPMVEVNIIK